MLPLSEARIRACIVNASAKERTNLVVPELDGLAWQHLEYLGWRDRKDPNLAYVVTELDGSPVGVVLRQAERTPRARAQCSWCEDVQLPNDVVFFSARRAGKAGRNGNTLGTLVCSNFECPVNVRRTPPMAYIGFDTDAERRRRIAALGENVRAFVTRVAQE